MAVFGDYFLDGPQDDDYVIMSPFEFEELAVKQMGENFPTRRWLLTNYDTWIKNPFWDGSGDNQHPDFQERQQND
jgi:hypothetical protein